MDEKTLAAGNRYRISLIRMSGAVEGLKHAIAERLLPVFTRNTEKFIAWITAHREWIALHVERAFAVVSQVMRGCSRSAWASSTSSSASGSRGDREGRADRPRRRGRALHRAVDVAHRGARAGGRGCRGLLRGKESITGRIVYAFQRLNEQMETFGIKHVFTEALEEAKKFLRTSTKDWPTAGQ